MVYWVPYVPFGILPLSKSASLVVGGCRDFRNPKTDTMLDAMRSVTLRRGGSSALVGSMGEGC